MSRPAWEYLTTHLPEIRRANIGEPGLALLVYLTGQTNKQGEFFMTAKTMQEETGMASLRQVEKLLATYIGLGWITATGSTVSYGGRGRPTPVYVLTLFPQYATIYARTVHESEHLPSRIPSGGTVEKTMEPNREGVSRVSIGSEPEPQPEPQVTSDQGGRAWGQEHELLLANCVATDLRLHPVKTDRGQIVPHLRKEYRPIVTRALKEQPPTDLVGWCYQVRRGHTIAPATTGRKGKQLDTNDLHSLFPGHHSLRQLDNADPNCKKCDGDGYFFHPDPIPGGYPNGEDFCPCIERNALRTVNE
jgi:hypothetical protein